MGYDLKLSPWLRANKSIPGFELKMTNYRYTFKVYLTQACVCDVNYRVAKNEFMTKLLLAIYLLVSVVMSRIVGFISTIDSISNHMHS